MKLSAIVLSKDSALNPLLKESLAFADEIVVRVCKNITDFASERNQALAEAKGDWVLFVDADEYVSRELALEIQKVITENKFSGFYLPRIDTVFHLPLRHGETGETKILRLGRRNSGKFSRAVHEIWKIKGRVGELHSPLYHVKDHFVSEFIGRMEQYTQIDAKNLNLENKPFSWFRLLINPLAKFKLNYIFRGGFLDGLPGLFLAYLMSVQSLTVRVFQWQNQK